MCLCIHTFKLVFFHFVFLNNNKFFSFFLSFNLSFILPFVYLTLNCNRGIFYFQFKCFLLLFFPSSVTRARHGNSSGTPCAIACCCHTNLDSLNLIDKQVFHFHFLKYKLYRHSSGCVCFGKNQHEMDFIFVFLLLLPFIYARLCVCE